METHITLLILLVSYAVNSFLYNFLIVISTSLLKGCTATYTGNNIHKQLYEYLFILHSVYCIFMLPAGKAHFAKLPAPHKRLFLED
jgi:hypothetical protein